MNLPAATGPLFGIEPGGRPYILILGSQSDWDVRFRMPNTESFTAQLMRQGARDRLGADPEYALERTVRNVSQLFDILDLSVRTQRFDVFIQLLSALESTVKEAFRDFWPNYRHFTAKEFACSRISFGQPGERASLYVGTTEYRDYRNLPASGWNAFFWFSEKATDYLMARDGIEDEQEVRRLLKSCASYYVGGFMRMMNDADYKRVPLILAALEKAFTAVAWKRGLPATS